MSRDTAKRAACEAAANMVQSGMRVGLGTGSTARWFTLSLATRVHRGLEIMCVPTSDETARLASVHGLSVEPLGADGVDLATDGADHVDPELRLIKGGGGAHVREKIVAAAARQFVIVVDEGKLRDVLPGVVPVELVQFGVDRTLALLDSTGGAFRLRRERSDNGNLLADGHYPSLNDPERLAAQLDAIPGLVGHGLFLGMTDVLVVGFDDGSIERRWPREDRQRSPWPPSSHTL